MINWRKMTAAERKQHKYDTRRVRKNFDKLASRDLTQREPKTRRIITRRNKVTPTGGPYHGRILLNRRQDRVAPYTEFQATARRLAQIERGQLREANGLIW